MIDILIHRSTLSEKGLFADRETLNTSWIGCIKYETILESEDLLTYNEWTKRAVEHLDGNGEEADRFLNAHSNRDTISGRWMRKRVSKPFSTVRDIDVLYLVVRKYRKVAVSISCSNDDSYSRLVSDCKRFIKYMHVTLACLSSSNRSKLEVDLSVGKSWLRNLDDILQDSCVAKRPLRNI